MTEPTLREISAELAALRTEVHRRHRGGGRFRRLALLALLAFSLALTPLALLAADPFTDLAPGSPHNGDIGLIRAAGITTGCTTTEYCPAAPVTRQEMASFLARTAGLGGNPPVANALTAQSAANANTVGGYAPDDLVRVVGETRTTALPMTLADDFQSFTALSIYGPRPGFVLVSGSVQLAHLSGTCPCAVAVRIRKITGSTFSSQPMIATIPNGVGERTSVSITWVAAVQAGSTQFDTLVDQVSGAGATQATVGEMTALYIPFSGTYTEP